MIDNSLGNQELYHFTSVETLLAILGSGRIRFSSLTKTNDPRESLAPEVEYKFIVPGEQLWLRFLDSWIEEHRHDYKVLCFSLDMNHEPYKKPRMWSQYASEHSGCCIVFGKDLFETELRLVAQKVFKGRIRYVETDTSDPRLAERKNEKIDRYFSRNIRYLCFTKNKDWETEKEFRYVLKNDKDVFVPIHSSLTCIYVSYKIDDLLLEKIIEVVCPRAIVRKIRWVNGFAEIHNEYRSYEDYMLVHVEKILQTILSRDVLVSSSYWSWDLDDLIGEYEKVPYPDKLTQEFIEPILHEYREMKSTKNLSKLIYARKNWPIQSMDFTNRQIELYSKMD